MPLQSARVISRSNYNTSSSFPLLHTCTESYPAKGLSNATIAFAMAAQAAFYYMPQQSTLPHITSRPARQAQRILHSSQPPKSKGGHKAVYPSEPVFLPILSTILSEQPAYDMDSQPAVWADGPHPLIPTPKRRKLVQSNLTTIAEE